MRDPKGLGQGWDVETLLERDKLDARRRKGEAMWRGEKRFPVEQYGWPLIKG